MEARRIQRLRATQAPKATTIAFLVGSLPPSLVGPNVRYFFVGVSASRLIAVLWLNYCTCDETVKV